MVPGYIVRNGVQMGLGRQAFFGVSAGNGAADDAEVAVEIAHTCQLRALGHLSQRCIDDHPVSWRYAGDLVTALYHRPEYIHAGNVRQLVARQREPTVAMNDVEVIDRRGRDLDHDITWARLRIGFLPVLQDLRSAMLFID